MHATGSKTLKYTKKCTFFGRLGLNSNKLKTYQLNQMNQLKVLDFWNWMLVFKVEVRLNLVYFKFSSKYRFF